MVDQLWFLAGQLARDRPFVQRLRNKPSYQRALRVLHRYPIGFVFCFRFVYGLRTVSPVVIGTSDLPAWQFVTLNGLAVVLWGPLLTWAGFQFGKALGPLLTDARSLMIASLFGLLSAALGYVAMRRLLARRRSKA